MIKYIPRGKALKAFLFIEEEGAQFTSDLAAYLGTGSHNVRPILEFALDNEIVGCETRPGRGRVPRETLWYLGPKADEVLERIRQTEGALA